MSPQSSKRRKAQPRKEGQSAPPTLEARISLVENFLRGHSASLLQQRQNLDCLHADNAKTVAGNQGYNAILGAVKKPTIKPRLEALIDRMSLLCCRIDGIDNTIAGGGASEVSIGGPPSIYSIPDQLEALENLIDRALDRSGIITDRF